MAERAVTVDEASLWRAYTEATEIVRSAQPRPPPATARASTQQPHSATGRWVDLHGLTIEQAARHVRSVLEDSRSRRSITFITGLSGSIRREFPLWLERHPRVRRVEMLDGGGAFRVVLAKTDQTRGQR